MNNILNKIILALLILGLAAWTASAAVPTFTAARTDVNTIVLTFNEAVTGTAIADSFTVVGASAVTNTAPTGSTTVTLTTTGLTATDGTPAVGYVATTGDIVSDSTNEEIADGGAIAAADQVPPTFVSAVTASTTTIDVTFSEPIVDNGATAGDFAIAGVASTPTVTVLSASGSVLTLTLNAAMTDADTPNAAYTGTGGSIDDLAVPANSLADFAAQSVTNNLDTTPPTFVSAVTASTTTIDVTFSEPIVDNGATPTDFVITGLFAGLTPTVTGLSASGSVLTLTLSNAMTDADTPLVAYHVTAGSIDDLAVPANSLADFAAQSVTNNLDTTPPESVTGLTNTTYAPDYINWTWSDPADIDFDHVEVYLNGVSQGNVLKGVQFFNATSLTPDTLYEIATRTVDVTGNVNQTWANATATTATAALPDMPPEITNFAVSPSTGISISNPATASADVADANMAGVDFLIIDSNNLVRINQTVLGILKNRSGLTGAYTSFPWNAFFAFVTNGTEANIVTVIGIDGVPACPFCADNFRVNGLFMKNATEPEIDVDAWFDKSTFNLTTITLPQGPPVEIEDGISTIRFARLEFANGLENPPSWNISGRIYPLYSIGLPANPYLAVGSQPERPRPIGWQFNTVPAGNYTVQVHAFDTADNNATQIKNITTADVTPPLITGVVLNTTTPLVGQAVLVTVDATDDTAVIGDVLANGIALAYVSGITWEGTITASAGTHSVNISASDAAGNVGWNNATTYAATTIVVPLPIDPGTGNTTTTVNVTSPSGNVTVTIPENTTATVNGNPLANISVNSTSLPSNASIALSANDRVVGEIVNLGPEGATFNPAIQVRFNYTEPLPSGVSEDNLQVSFFNASANSWEILTIVERNTVQNYVIANVSHFDFGTFALIGTSTTTTTTTGTSGSGGSSGGGGVVTGEPYTNIEKAERYDKSLIANTSVTYAFKVPELGIYEIAVTGKESENDIAVRVEALKGTSKLVKEPAPGVVYRNVNIWSGTKRIKEVLIRFKVENSWLDSNSLAGSKVRMVQWRENIWVQLDTTEKTKDSTYTYYETKTDSLSSFAIVGLKSVAVPLGTPAIEVTETPVTKETAPTTATPTEKEVPGFGIALAMAAISALYMLRKGKK